MRMKMYKYELCSINKVEKCEWSSYAYYSIGETISLSGQKYIVTKVIM
ncbi:MAG: hypothetical protein IJA10_10590 [Lachnospiraceae bacterium]|nr:hypothetical protein [Lachnospiraceae bacterium]